VSSCLLLTLLCRCLLFLQKALSRPGIVLAGGSVYFLLSIASRSGRCDCTSPLASSINARFIVVFDRALDAAWFERSCLRGAFDHASLSWYRFLSVSCWFFLPPGRLVGMPLISPTCALSTLAMVYLALVYFPEHPRLHVRFS
jgi:hypothetical protein